MVCSINGQDEEEKYVLKVKVQSIASSYHANISESEKKQWEWLKVKVWFAYILCQPPDFVDSPFSMTNLQRESDPWTEGCIHPSIHIKDKTNGKTSEISVPSQLSIQFLALMAWNGSFPPLGVMVSRAKTPFESVSGVPGPKRVLAVVVSD